MGQRPYPKLPGPFSLEKSPKNGSKTLPSNVRLSLFFSFLLGPFLSFSKPTRPPTPLVFLIKFSKKTPQINQSINSYFVTEL